MAGNRQNDLSDFDNIEKSLNPAGMRLESINGCINEDGIMTFLHLNLVSENGEKYAHDSIGQQGKNDVCTSLKLE